MLLSSYCGVDNLTARKFIRKYQMSTTDKLILLNMIQSSQLGFVGAINAEFTMPPLPQNAKRRVHMTGHVAESV